jgi:hypothetical protein
MADAGRVGESAFGWWGMSGTAYRTPIPATVYTTPSDTAAVYAVFPPAVFDSGFSSTTFLLVASNNLIKDTVVHPCDRNGQMLGFDLVAQVGVPNHRVALRAAGYELEAVPHVA